MISELREKILRLKKAKNAVILAHYYQEDSIQEVADFIGDSLGLSQQAAGTSADIIVFAGVHFMAETAKILNPGKKVLLPDMNAGCSLAESCPPDRFRHFLSKHPDHTVISYINCSAEIKAMSDIICTSANALHIVKSLPPEQKIIFAPDKNLGRYIEKTLNRKMVLWDGECVVHAAFSLEKLKKLREQYPASLVVAHPEAEEQILETADFIGSTTAMILYIKESAATEFIIATEAGILRQMKLDAPGKKLIAAPAKENNSCACSECPYMKMNSLEKLCNCLENESNEIFMDEALRLRALAPLKRMLEFSGIIVKPPVHA